MLWFLFLPFLVLRFVLKLVFGLVFGVLGLVFGLVLGALGLAVGLGASAFAIGVTLTVLLAPLLPFLLLAFVIWLGIKGTRALATV